MLLQHNAAAADDSSSASATACGNCGIEDLLLLNNFRYRGTYRRLCTACVLRTHPQSFCPTCFQVYPPPPTNGAFLSCSKCASLTHSQCVAAHPSPYICPLCVSPGASIFKSKAAEKGNFQDLMLLDRDDKKKLLAAARIVAASLNKAAEAAKAAAEMKAREVVLTRKRAKGFLELLAHLEMKDKLNKKATPPVAAAPLTGPRVGFTRTKIGGAEFRANVKLGETSAPRPTSMVGNGGELLDWSDTDIDEMLFPDDDNPD